MASDVGRLRSHTLGPCEEPLDLTMLIVGEITQVGRQIDNATKTVYGGKTGPRVE